ncbi:MAG: hypothetical protein V3U02_04425 [Calditrichia bacterium]
MSKETEDKNEKKKNELIPIPDWLPDADKVKVELAKKALLNLLVDGIITEFKDIPFWARVFVCQKIPKIFISTRVIAKQKNKKTGNWEEIKAPYIKHPILKKYAAFLFLHKIQNELMSKEFFSFTEIRKYKDNGSWVEKEVDGSTAEAHVRFKLYVEDEWLIRDVYSSWKQYSSKATNRGHCLQSAMSRSWAIMLESFGVGANLKEQEDRAFAKAKKSENQIIDIEDDLGEEGNAPKPKQEPKKKRSWEK